MIRAFIVAVLFLGFVSLSPSAWAARRAVVDAAEVEVRKGPTDESEILAKLSKGSQLAVSNYPTEGFYKVRTPKGEIGWVKADTLVLGALPDLKGNSNSSEEDR